MRAVQRMQKPAAQLASQARPAVVVRVARQGVEEERGRPGLEARPAPAEWWVSVVGLRALLVVLRELVVGLRALPELIREPVVGLRALAVVLREPAVGLRGPGAMMREPVVALRALVEVLRERAAALRALEGDLEAVVGLAARAAHRTATTVATARRAGRARRPRSAAWSFSRVK